MMGFRRFYTETLQALRLAGFALEAVAAFGSFIRGKLLCAFPRNRWLRPPNPRGFEDRSTLLIFSFGAASFSPPYFRIAASMSSMERGMDSDRLTQPVSVTRQLSSRRKPMPQSSL